MQNASFFSRAPLNYDTLLQRFAQFHARPVPTLALLLDYIRANRRLQQQAREEGLGYGSRRGAAGLFGPAQNLFGPMDSPTGAADVLRDPNSLAQLTERLGVRLLAPAPQLQRELWQFLVRYWPHAAVNEDVVRQYVLGSTCSEVGHLFQLVAECFRHNLSCNVVRTGSVLSPAVDVLLRVLLRRKDYHNCFRLLDDTYASAELTAAKRSHCMRQAVNAFICYVGVGAVAVGIAAIVDASAAFAVFVCSLVLSGVACAFTHAALEVVRVCLLLRVSWRRYVPFVHRYLQCEHSAAVDRMVSYFEEHHEVNTKNYHLLQDCDRAAVVQDDYDVVVPYEIELAGRAAHTHAVQAHSTLLRAELLRRKLTWKPLKEEQSFLEYWKSQGRGFEWVEPDQDPAEMWQGFSKLAKP